MFRAKILLKPSFHPNHLWMVLGDQARVEVVGRCKPFSAVWRLTQKQIVEANRTVFNLAYEPPSKMHSGFDGIDVEYKIETPTGSQTTKIWGPTEALCRDHWVLTRWCWYGLYGKNPLYNGYLAQLYSYFSNWEAPI
jgi:hypothetical protein